MHYIYVCVETLKAQVNDCLRLRYDLTSNNRYNEDYKNDQIRKIDQRVSALELGIEALRTSNNVPSKTYKSISIQ